MGLIARGSDESFLQVLGSSSAIAPCQVAAPLIGVWGQSLRLHGCMVLHGAAGFTSDTRVNQIAQHAHTCTLLLLCLPS
jgi:hypothetical protein